MAQAPPPTWDRWQIVVPARLASSRLPNKPLQDLNGKPLVVRVLDNLASFSTKGVQLTVATDADAIAKACRDHGYTATMTRQDHISGTDRCHEVAAQYPDREFVLNVQCDEPFLAHSDVAALMAGLEQDPGAQMATLVYKCQDPVRFADPNTVKAIRNSQGRAIYFSRSSLPHHRDTQKQVRFWLHVGLYAFRLPKMTQFCQLPPSPLEQTEKLEQLRAVENGWSITLVEAQHLTIGIDTPEDLEEARGRY